MFLIVHTTREIYTINIHTMTLYNGNAQEIAHGYFHIAAIILRAKVTAFEKVDCYGNQIYSIGKHKLRAMV